MWRGMRVLLGCRRASDGCTGGCRRRDFSGPHQTRSGARLVLPEWSHCPTSRCWPAWPPVTRRRPRRSYAATRRASTGWRARSSAARRWPRTSPRRRGRVTTWLLTITRNTAIDAVRYQRELPTDPSLLLGVLDGRADGAPDPSDVDSRDDLRRALGKLPSEQSLPLVLMVLYGLTARDIAEREGIPVGTVKTRVRRGFSLLRQGLGVSDD